MIKDDGGTAFPSKDTRTGTCEHCNGTYYYDHEGMSLRDYFMAHAPDIDPEVNIEWVEKAFPKIGKCPKWDNDPVANNTWWIKANVAFKARFTDAMLEERNKL